MITITNLSMRFGAKILFKNVTFQLNPGQHYGLVGANGSGKSTLMKILTKDMTAEEGSFAFPSNFLVGTLKQDHFLYENDKIINIVLMGNPLLWKALNEKEMLFENENFNEASCDRLEELEKVILHHKGYSAPSEAAKLLEGLGILSNVHEQPLSTLSGGFKLRVLLAQVLFSNPDILLLDEPTNHLDIYSIRWLEGYLASFPGTILLSSHDKDFLNGICDYILDVDHQTIKSYKGNYDDFLETKAADLIQRTSLLEKQGKKRDDLQVFITRFGAKATKATQASSKAKLVEKLETEMSASEIGPTSRHYPKFRFDQSRPSGAIPLVVSGLDKNYGERRVFANISFEVMRGDRIAILGANGIGKSTLLEILFGNKEPTKGSFTFGHGAKISYFPQDHKQEIEGSENLLDWLRQFSPGTPDQKLREVLGRNLFSGDDVKKMTKILSGGELARLIIAKMMISNHNILIFDEPTNHLDMESTDALLEALDNYPGTIIFVSHNRYFISAIANRVIEMTKDGVKDFRCSYAEYLEKREIDLLSAKGKRFEKDASVGKEKQNYEEQKVLRNLKNQNEKKMALAEKKYHQTEEKLKKLVEQISVDDFYTKTPKDTLQKIMTEQSLLERQLDDALTEWESLM